MKNAIKSILSIGLVFTIGILLYKWLGNLDQFGIGGDFAPLIYLIPLLIFTVWGFRRWSR